MNDNIDDRIEYIQDIQDKAFKVDKRQSAVLNNFYSIVTIIIVCLSIIFYTVYIVPAQDAKKQRELQLKQKNELIDKRAKQIALSHKLNQPKKVIKTYDSK